MRSTGGVEPVVPTCQSGGGGTFRSRVVRAQIRVVFSAMITKDQMGQKGMSRKLATMLRDASRIAAVSPSCDPAERPQRFRR